MEREHSAERETVEDDGGDVAGVIVAGDTLPEGAGVRFYGDERGLGPGVDDLSERVGCDPFLEFEEGLELRDGGGVDKEE